MAILVFGCGGDRDVRKRPEMGRVASELADLIIITSDNPRSEEPADICEQISDGMKERDVVEVVLDREEAIARALDAAGPGDVVLIAGKGHETSQTYANRNIPFDDRVVARRLLS